MVGTAEKRGWLYFHNVCTELTRGLHAQHVAGAVAACEEALRGRQPGRVALGELGARVALELDACAAQGQDGHGRAGLIGGMDLLCNDNSVIQGAIQLRRSRGSIMDAILRFFAHQPKAFVKMQRMHNAKYVLRRRRDLTKDVGFLSRFAIR